MSKVPFSVNKYAVFINDVKVRLTKVYEFALLTMYSMYYESSMRKAILYIAALLMITVQCKSSVPNGTTKSTNRIPTIKRSNIQEEPFDFIDSSAVYALKINGRDAAKQLDLTPEKIQQIIEEQFDLSGKPMMQKIILNNIRAIMEEDMLIYIFQDSLSNSNDLKTALKPYIILESTELCKFLRLSKFNRDIKTRKKGGLRSLENESIPYHIVWSKNMFSLLKRAHMLLMTYTRNLKNKKSQHLPVIHCMILYHQEILFRIHKH